MDLDNKIYAVEEYCYASTVREVQVKHLLERQFWYDSGELIDFNAYCSLLNHQLIEEILDYEEIYKKEQLIESGSRLIIVVDESNVYRVLHHV